MAGEPWPEGKHLSLLPLVREYEDEVEGDFQFHYGIDYRDRYRPGGGDARLTLRRLLVLVDRLPPESAFKSACENRLPVSEVSAAVGDVVKALSGKPWGRWTALQKAQEHAERQKLIAVKREEARRFNAARQKHF